MARQAFRPKKSLGQNFLVDSRVNARIVKALELTGGELVVEIGVGRGHLTRRLAPACGRLLAFEVDERLRAEHAALQAEYANLEIEYRDFLEASLPEIHQRFPELPMVVAGNIPYHLTAPILFKLFGQSCVERAGLTVQKEVAERITAAPGSSDYSLLSVLCGYYFTPELRFVIPARCFRPRPKVDSAFVLLRVRKERELAAAEEPAFRRLVKAAFAHRRKTLLNSLLLDEAYAGRRGALENALAGMDIAPKARPQELTHRQYVELLKRLE